MTRGTTEITQQNSERAMQATNLGMHWALELAEQSLNQSKVVVDGLFKVTRKMAEEFENQTSATHEHSTSLIETTLSNTFDFGHKLSRLRGPQELVELQSEFLSRQSQAIADHTKELGQKIKNGTTGAAARPSRAA